ncbi:NERD domain-containing protein [Salipaludibacillus daqingensis]|uniref:NERD domain-containing protein n=1 Tax=Salipaludibacillus daqingensis TaxID=3041001 RepID=UPI0024736E41|nr:NERD domain-containing protein [Salipaludibacillus daqingensis]
MIVKPHVPPTELRILQAKINRLVEGHPQLNDILSEYYKRASGYYGEKSISYYLDFLDGSTTVIMHSLRLPYKKYFFQMDTLVLFTSFSLIVETKHWAGSIEVQETGEIIRTYNDVQSSFSCPVQQVKHQAWQLSEWTKYKKLTIPKLHYVSVFTKSKMIINESKNLSPLLIRSNYLLDHIRHLESSTEATKTKTYTINEMKKIANFLKKSHQELELSKSSLDMHELKKSDIIRGVQCSGCKRISMNRMKRTWKCPECGVTSQNAHIQAIIDYVFLFGRYATTAELLEFLNIQECGVLRRLLIKLDVSRKKNSKKQKFDLLSSKEIRKGVYH